MDDRRLPDYLLERLALGELSPDAARDAEARLAQEEGGPRRLEELRASNAELLAQHPPTKVAGEIARRQRAVVVEIAPRRWSWLAAPASVLAAALLVVMLRPAPETTTVKGDAALLVYRNHGGEPELLANGATAGAGDVLQLAYVRARPEYGVILSVDGKGATTLHLPDRNLDAVRLVADARTLLPHAYELDAAPDFERFFLVTSEKPFVVSVALEAARKLAADGAARTGPLPLPATFAQTSFLLIKSRR